MAKVTMPQLGESVAEGTIGKWLKKPGDHVAKYEPLLEVITDKVNAEVPSPFEGILKQILVEEGQTVPNNAEIAVIDEAVVEAAAEAPAAEAPAAEAVASEALPAEPEAGHGPAGSDERPVEEMGDRNGSTPSREVLAASAPPAASVATSAPAAEPVPVMDEQLGNPDARMTPAVRRLLREHGLTAAQIAGTGHSGRITRDDVIAYVERARTGGTAAPLQAAPAGAASPPAQPSATVPAAPSQGVQPAPSGPWPASPAPASPAPASTPAPAPAPSVAWEAGVDEELVPLNQMRRGIAAQMVKANAVPVAYSTFECDMTAVARLREAAGAEYKAREGVGLSYLPFVVKSVVEALKRSPDLNAHYTEAGLLRKRRINIGIAVAVDNGLIVPVIHDADGLSIAGINRAIQDLAGRARANRLRLEDLQGGTFTVDNTGWFGSVVSTPIINTPEVCILTTEAVVKRPVVREMPEGDVIAVRSMMNLCAGFDHRATDGAQIGRFMGDVVRWLQAVGPDTSIF